MLPRLQYISQGSTPEIQVRHIREALDAGCTWIQLRMKQATAGDLLTTAQQVRELCITYNAIFIINDHPAIAAAVGADGVHLGLTDMPVSEARAVVGKEKIIGGTANTLADVIQRYEEGCDYAGVGPFRFTTTKEKLSPILGVAGYQQILEAMAEAGISMPLIAIGGITPADVAGLVETGVHGIAVSGLITHNDHKKQIVQQLNNQLYATTFHKG
ncbi:thiamine-phosphate diphosphorylase [Cnuella takakiae]|nr:thiamine-phosphate diphosphorylase [Cnuella takakiae]